MSSIKLLLVSAAAKIVRPGSEPPPIIVVHQVLCNDNLQQNKTALNSNTMRLHGVLVDDCSACFILPCGCAGKQKTVVNDKEIGLTFNGCHCFLPFKFPLENNFKECESVELTSLSEHDQFLFIKDQVN